MVRLTNHYDVAEQTEENGDVVTYLKMQASQDDFYSIVGRFVFPIFSKFGSLMRKLYHRFYEIM